MSRADRGSSRRGRRSGPWPDGSWVPSPAAITRRDRGAALLEGTPTFRAPQLNGCSASGRRRSGHAKPYRDVRVVLGRGVTPDEPERVRPGPQRRDDRCPLDGFGATSRTGGQRGDATWYRPVHTDLEASRGKGPRPGLSPLVMAPSDEHPQRDSNPCRHLESRARMVQPVLVCGVSPDQGVAPVHRLRQHPWRWLWSVTKFVTKSETHPIAATEVRGAVPSGWAGPREVRRWTAKLLHRVVIRRRKHDAQTEQTGQTATVG